jgi:hypothetical protein
MIDAYGDRIDVPWLWEQLKTFVEKDLRSQSTQRQTRYQAADSRYDYDDTIFGITFAYINAVAHAQLISVPVHPLTALVTVTALANHLVPLVITKWSVSRTQVSDPHVAALIPAWITAAIPSSSVVAEKSSPVMS